MLHAAATVALLAFAPPSAQPSAQDLPDEIVELADAGLPDADLDAEALPDPAFLALYGALSPEAQERLDVMDEEALGALLDRHVGGEAATGVDGEIAEALVKAQIDGFDASLRYQTGDVALGSGLATLHLGDDFRFLGPDDARTVIVDAWGNPPENGACLGMIVPADTSPIHPAEGWGVIITYSEDGHVDDDDAEDIDYDEMLEEMKSDTLAANADRQRRGFPAMTMIGWAAKPHYDSATKRLYWAKELRLADVPENTLNYDIRVLGRKGVLELSAIGTMSMLPRIGPQMEAVLTTVEFDTGNRYEDFDPDVDAVAAYGIGGLVAGKLLAKAGFFAIILKFLIAGKKLLVVGLVAVGLFVKKLFSRGEAS